MTEPPPRANGVEALPPRQNLAAFTTSGYDKGRSVTWQVAWFAFSNLIFKKWWFPPRLRPASLRLFGAKVGKGVLVRHGVQIHWPWKLVLRDNCWLGEGVHILNLEPVVVGSSTCISQSAVICTGNHRSDRVDFRFDNRSIEIGASVWIGMQAFIGPGAYVSDGVVVAARQLLRGGTVPPDVVVNAGGPLATTTPRRILP